MLANKLLKELIEDSLNFLDDKPYVRSVSLAQYLQVEATYISARTGVSYELVEDALNEGAKNRQKQWKQINMV